MCFETLYKLYKFLALVEINQIKCWTNDKFSINLTATNSKKSMHIIHDMFFPEVRGECYTQLIMLILITSLFMSFIVMIITIIMMMIVSIIMMDAKL